MNDAVLAVCSALYARRLRRIAALCLFAVQACASRQAALPTDVDPASMTGSGAIVGSVTSAPDDRWNPPYFQPSAYYYRGVDDPTVNGVLRSGSGSTVGQWDSERCAPGIPDEYAGAQHRGSIPRSDCGRLFALTLPAGRYRIHTVQFRQPNATSVEPASLFSRPLESMEWTVTAGEVRYLGELRSRICMGSTGHGLRVSTVHGEVRDAFTRDLPLLVARFPALRGRQIVPRALPSAPWTWQWPAGGLPDACGDDPLTSTRR